MELDELRDMMERQHADVKQELGKVRESQADIAQMAGQVTYIFSDKGPWHSLNEQVETHERAYQRGKGIIGLLTFGFAAGFLEWLKNHWGGRH